jgi:hypothetical protein
MDPWLFQGNSMDRQQWWIVRLAMFEKAMAMGLAKEAS